MFDFRKVRNVADYLSQRNSEEYSRSAISRYYYSLFCCVRLYLVFIRHEDEFVRGRDVHKRMCNRLLKSSDPTEHTLGKSLEKLRVDRNLADYDFFEMDCHFLKQKLDFARKESKVGLEQIDALRSSPPFEL